MRSGPACKCKGLLSLNQPLVQTRQGYGLRSLAAQSMVKMFLLNGKVFYMDRCACVTARYYFW